MDIYIYVIWIFAYMPAARLYKNQSEAFFHTNWHIA